MNLRPLTPRQHATASLLLLLLLLLVFHMVVVMPAISGRAELNTRLEDLRFQYAKLVRLASRQEEITRELQQLRQSRTNEDGFLKQATPPLAAAELQRRLGQLIEKNGAGLISTQVVNLDTTGVFPPVTIKVNLRSDMESLMRTLYEIESGPPVLFVNDLYIQSRDRISSRMARGRNPRAETEQLLEVRFDVTGYIFQNEPR